MTNPARRKGTSWETTWVDYLNERDFGAKRTGSSDADAGDVHASGWTFELKAEREIDLPGYLKQLALAMARHPTRPSWKAAAVIKNRRHGTDDSYVVMSGYNFRDLMTYVAMLENAVEEASDGEIILPNREA